MSVKVNKRSRCGPRDGVPAVEPRGYGAVYPVRNTKYLSI